MKMLALILQLALAMLTAILIGGLIGYAIDAYFHTSLLVVFLVLGAAGGYKSCYDIIRKFTGR